MTPNNPEVDRPDNLLANRPETIDSGPTGSRATRIVRRADRLDLIAAARNDATLDDAIAFVS